MLKDLAKISLLIEFFLLWVSTNRGQTLLQGMMIGSIFKDLLIIFSEE